MGFWGTLWVLHCSSPCVSSLALMRRSSSWLSSCVSANLARSRVDSILFFRVPLCTGREKVLGSLPISILLLSWREGGGNPIHGHAPYGARQPFPLSLSWVEERRECPSSVQQVYPVGGGRGLSPFHEPHQPCWISTFHPMYRGLHRFWFQRGGKPD